MSRLNFFKSSQEKLKLKLDKQLGATGEGRALAGFYFDALSTVVGQDKKTWGRYSEWDFTDHSATRLFNWVFDRIKSDSRVANELIMQIFSDAGTASLLISSKADFDLIRTVTKAHESVFLSQLHTVLLGITLPKGKDQDFVDINREVQTFLREAREEASVKASEASTASQSVEPANVKVTASGDETLEASSSADSSVMPPVQEQSASDVSVGSDDAEAVVENQDDSKSCNYDSDSFESASEDAQDDDSRSVESMASSIPEEIVIEEDDDALVDSLAEQMANKAIADAETRLLAEQEQERKLVDTFLEGIVDQVESSVSQAQYVANTMVQKSIKAGSDAVKEQKQQAALELAQLQKKTEVVVQEPTLQPAPVKVEVQEIAQQPAQAKAVVEENKTHKKNKKAKSSHSDVASSHSSQEQAPVRDKKPKKSKKAIIVDSPVFVWAPSISAAIKKYDIEEQKLKQAQEKPKFDVLNREVTEATRSIKTARESVIEAALAEFMSHQSGDKDAKKALSKIYLKFFTQHHKDNLLLSVRALERICPAVDISPVDAFIRVYKALIDAQLKKNLIKVVFFSSAHLVLFSAQDYIDLYRFILSENGDRFETELTSKAPPVPLLIAQLGEQNFKFLTNRQEIGVFLTQLSPRNLTDLENYVKAKRSSDSLGAGGLFYLYHQYFNQMGMFAQGIGSQSSAEQVAFFEQQLRGLEIQATDTECDIFFKIATFMLSTYNRAFETPDSKRTTGHKFILRQTEGHRLRGMLNDILSSCAPTIFGHTSCALRKFSSGNVDLLKGIERKLWEKQSGFDEKLYQKIQSLGDSVSIRWTGEDKYEAIKAKGIGYASVYFNQSEVACIRSVLEASQMDDISEKLVNVDDMKSDLTEARQRLAALEISVPYELSRVTTEKDLLGHIAKYHDHETAELFVAYAKCMQHSHLKDYVKTLVSILNKNLTPLDSFIEVYKALRTTAQRQHLIQSIFPALANHILTTPDDHLALYAMVLPNDIDSHELHAEKSAELNILVAQLCKATFNYLTNPVEVSSFFKKLPIFVSDLMTRLPIENSWVSLYVHYSTLVFFPEWPGCAKDATKFETFIGIWQFLKKSIYIRYHDKEVDRRQYTNLLKMFFQLVDVMAVTADNLTLLHSLMPSERDIPKQMKSASGDMVGFPSDQVESELRYYQLVKEDFITKVKENRSINKEIKDTFFTQIGRNDLIEKRKTDSSNYVGKRVSESAKSTASSSAPVKLTERKFLTAWGVNDETAGKVKHVFRLDSPEDHVKRAVAELCFEAFAKPKQQGNGAALHAHTVAAHQESLALFEEYGFFNEDRSNSLVLETPLQKFLWILKNITRDARPGLVEQVFSEPAYVKYLLANADPKVQLDNFVTLMRIVKADQARHLCDIIISQLKLVLFKYVGKNQSNVMMQLVSLYISAKTRDEMVAIVGCHPLFALYAHYCNFIEDKSRFDKGHDLYRLAYQNEAHYFKAILEKVSIEKRQAFLAGIPGKYRELFGLPANTPVAPLSQKSYYTRLSKGLHDVADSGRIVIGRAAQAIQQVGVTSAEDYFAHVLKGVSAEKHDLYRIYFNALCGKTASQPGMSLVDIDKAPKLKVVIDSLLSGVKTNVPEYEQVIKVYEHIANVSQAAPANIQVVRAQLIRDMLSNAKHVDVIFTGTCACRGLQQHLSEDHQKMLAQQVQEFDQFTQRRKSKVEAVLNSVEAEFISKLERPTGFIERLCRAYAQQVIQSLIKPESYAYIARNALTVVVDRVNSILSECVSACNDASGDTRPEMSQFLSLCKFTQDQKLNSEQLIRDISTESFAVILGDYTPNDFESKKTAMLSQAEARGISEATRSLIAQQINAVEDARIQVDAAQLRQFDVVDPEEVHKLELNDVMDELIARLMRYQKHLNKEDEVIKSPGFEEHLFRDDEEHRDIVSQPDLEGAILMSFSAKSLDNSEVAAVVSESELKEKKKYAVERLIDQAQAVKDMLNQGPVARTPQQIADHAIGLAASLAALKDSFEAKKDIISKDCGIGRMLVGAVAVLLVLPAIFLAIRSKVNKTRNTFNFFKSHGSAVVTDVAVDYEKLSPTQRTPNR